MRLGPGDLPVLDVLGLGLLRLALLLAVGVDVGVRQDPVQPRLEVGARLVLVERGEGLGERLLHEVLGVGGVAGHAQGRRVELVEVLQRLALEARGPLLARLVGRRPARVLTHHR